MAAALAAGTAALLVRRVAVVGDSMRPSLEAGDRVLAVRARGRRGVRPGQLVVVRDPRLPARLLVKRVTAAGAGGVVVRGDNVGASTDSRDFGPVDRVWGRVVYRYAPPARAGRIGGGR